METKPNKLRKIKTIRWTTDRSVGFDREVNEALAEGWYLVKRYTLPGYHEGEDALFIAELQRFDDYDE